jgi:hypothetical protein
VLIFFLISRPTRTAYSISDLRLQRMVDFLFSKGVSRLIDDRIVSENSAPFEFEINVDEQNVENALCIDCRVNP